MSRWLGSSVLIRDIPRACGEDEENKAIIMQILERALIQVLGTAYGFKSGQRGQGMAEYGLILALVAVVVIGALTVLGGGISSTFNTLSSQV